MEKSQENGSMDDNMQGPIYQEARKSKESWKLSSAWSRPFRIGICSRLAERGRAVERGGWKTMPFILGNEVCDKLAAIGLLFSMILYLTQDFHFELVTAANILSISSGTGYISPLIGGYLADAYLGRFWTLIISSFVTLVGMLFLVFTSAISSLRPKPCASEDLLPSLCAHPSAGQVSFLYLAFILLAIGSGGIKPCSYPFGADQFSQDTFEGKKAFQSFSNWYFFNIYLTVLLSGTVIVYVQQSVSWTMGFGIPTIAMAVAIVLYVMGTPLYKYETPAGSPLKELAKVCSAGFRKRKLTLPDDSRSLLDPQGDELTNKLFGEKLVHTDQFRFLDKAAIISDGDLDADGKVVNPWRICTVNQVEQLKLVIKTMPVMLSAMIHATAVSQQTSFSVLQANTMERHMFGSFQIPAASIGVFAMLTIMICLPIYDKVVLPIARRVTGTERGITFLQRIGVGYCMGGAAMLLSGIVEAKRRSVADAHGLAYKPKAVVPMSVFWLVPQLSLMGVGETFNGIGTAEFFYDQVPEGMRSTAGALNSLSSGVGVYVSAVILTTVHIATKKGGKVSWLDDNLNRGRLDRYYYLVSAMIMFNLFYFLVCARWYSYKKAIIIRTANRVDDDDRNALHSSGALPQMGVRKCAHERDQELGLVARALADATVEPQRAEGSHQSTQATQQPPAENSCSHLAVPKHV